MAIDLLTQAQVVGIATSESGLIMVVVHGSDSESDDEGCGIPVLHRRSSHIAAEMLGIKPLQYRQLKRWRYPSIMFDMLICMVVTFGLPSPHLSVIEWFSGVESVVRGCQEQGLAAYGYDYEKSASHDFMTAEGFVVAMELARSLRDYGLQHWATRCSSWVWIAWDKCGRSLSSPMGRDVPSVRAANCMVSRMCLLAMYMLCRGACFILEQPSSSLMKLHTRMRETPFKTMYEYSTWMCAFGAAAPKRGLLLVDSPLVGAQLSKSITRKEFLGSGSATTLTRPATRKHVKKRVYGTKTLKGTQAYPVVIVTCGHSLWPFELCGTVMELGFYAVEIFQEANS